MNLLNLLLSSMTSQSSVESLTGKTGLSSKQIQTLVMIALPILLKAMTNNASSQSGATSLLGALTQHTNKKNFSDQLTEADAEDGAKIVSHILGGESDAVVKELAGETGISADQVQSVLANIAPVLMSGVSAAATSASEQKTEAANVDLTSLMSLFGGASAQAAKPASGAADGTALLSALLSMMG